MQSDVFLQIFKVGLFVQRDLRHVFEKPPDFDATQLHGQVQVDRVEVLAEVIHANLVVVIAEGDLILCVEFVHVVRQISDAQLESPFVSRLTLDVIHRGVLMQPADLAAVFVHHSHGVQPVKSSFAAAQAASQELNYPLK